MVKRVLVTGMSATGKSTVLGLIAGLEHPDVGRVAIGGVDSTDVPPQRRAVGFVFQSYALFPHMTVRRNIAFGLHVRKAPQAQIDVLAVREELVGERPDLLKHRRAVQGRTPAGQEHVGSRG